MYKSEIPLEENMKKFEKIITLNSLTSEEIFMKNATKSNLMQVRAIDIILDAMKKVLDENNENAMREVNMDAFI